MTDAIGDAIQIVGLNLVDPQSRERRERNIHAVHHARRLESERSGGEVRTDHGIDSRPRQSQRQRAAVGVLQIPKTQRVSRVGWERRRNTLPNRTALRAAPCGGNHTQTGISRTFERGAECGVGQIRRERPRASET